MRSFRTSARRAAPEVRAVNVRVIVFSLPRVRLAIDLSVHNPNPTSLSLAGLDVALSVEGEPVARASLASPVTLPANQSATVRLEASGSLGAALAGVGRRLDRGGGPLHYEIAGSARLDDGTTYPFLRRGELAHL